MKSSSKVSSFLNKPERAAYLFIAPAILVLLIFMFIPLVSTIAVSTLRMDVFMQSATFIGLDHFIRMMGDGKFWNAFGNTAYFTAFEVPLQIAVSLLAAVYVSRNTRLRKFVRSALFLPFVCSLTAIGIMWSFLLDPQIGLYTEYLTRLGLPRLAFLRDPQLAMPAVILMTVWRNFGYTMVILVAAVQTIPASYYEAAQLDGAGKFRQFANVTIPSIVPALGFSVITATIMALQVFDQIFVTTQGGPLGKTETLVTYIYKSGFQTAPYDLGYASAISVMTLIFIMIVSLTMNRYFQSKESTDAR
ncbi:carbohydrate ABC transporter permease [Paenibacillus arenilitoris]|uniref:Sugar ABC transporter permease n=1 Tax=Paenibacillus arenilitoris TaxID=2772299 RepID=A0A927H7B8_9BACL|nr:sugar ABC transporter permease [Paenibacillus arenilitoris]MBD2869434.1 sugar ABC transporter permease [Paenibacillus arenilitoris]